MKISPAPPSLNVFISYVFNNASSPKETKLLQDLSLLTLEKNFTEFTNFLKTLNEDQVKAISTQKLKNSLIRHIAKQKTFTQEHYDLLAENILNLELKNFIGFKKNNSFTSGLELLEKLIQEQSPKNERVEAVYSLMGDYKKAFEANIPLDLAEIEKYKEKINSKNIEKQIKQSQNFYWVNRFGNKVRSSSSNKYNQKQSVSTTNRRVKTEDQKGFEQVFVVFLHFLVKHLRSDFLSILNIFDLDFLTAFKKISRFNPAESLEVWKKLTNRLDLKSYYDSLDPDQKDEFAQLFAKIKENIEKLSYKQTKIYNGSGRLDFQVGTKQNIEKILIFCLAMKGAGFKASQIVDSLGIFETSFKKNYPSNLPMQDLLFQFLPSQVKLSKERKESMQFLMTQYEKEALDNVLELKQKGAKDKKISVKKYKI